MNKHTVYLLSKIASNLSLIKGKLKDSLENKEYIELREIINDCQESMALHCDCAPIKLISGSIKKDIEKNEKTKKDLHKNLFNILIKKKSDYKDYGGEIERFENEKESYPDCSCGCKHFIPLEEELGADWGVCVNPNSERQGLLTWEHQNGYKCFEEE